MKRFIALGAAAAIVLSIVAAAPARAVTPGNQQLVANGTAVDGPCSLVDGQTSDELKAWFALTVDPARIKASPKGGDELTPTGLPYGTPGELASGTVNPNTLFAESLQGNATGTPSGCQAFGNTSDTQVSGSSVTLYRPGPYVFEQHDFTEDFVLVADGSADPTPTVCAQNDSHYPDEPGMQHPPDPANAHYAISAYCNQVTLIPFFVQGSTGGCPVTADMSQWPTVPYINQYDAGARLGLPVSSGSYGKAGGNACGPSSLLMGLLAQGHRDSEEDQTNELVTPMPDLPTVFDRTMLEPRSQVTNGDHNAFSGYPKATTYLKSLGYRQAHPIPLGTDLESIAGLNLTTIHNALVDGPALASTAFSTSDWGMTGGGHIILLAGTDQSRPEEIKVDDPAGNYFSSPYSSYFANGGHYGPGSCGYDVLYPNAWVLAMTTGRWVMPLGHRHGVGGARASSARDAGSNSAFALYDAHPGQPDAPQSFYLQDPEGRRAGYVDGQIVTDIPDSAAGQDPPEWTDPAGGDPSLDGSLPDPPPTPRSVVIPNPEPGTTVHVVAGASGSYALTAEAWADGTQTNADNLSGQSSQGQDVTLSSPALASLTPTVTIPPTTTPPPTSTAGSSSLRAGKLTVRHGKLTLRLACTGGGIACHAAVTLTARDGRRTLTLKRMRLTIAAGTTKRVSIALAHAAHRLPRRLRREQATLRVMSGARRVLQRRVRL